MSATTIGYLFYIGVIVVVSAMSLVIDPPYIIGALIGMPGLFLVFHYPFFGFVLYLLPYFLRPGERFPALAPLRLKLTFGVVPLLAIIIHDALKGTKIRFPSDKVAVSLLGFIGAFWLGVVGAIKTARSTAPILQQPSKRLARDDRPS
ncbi:MAG: hypothetical protein ACUVWA_15340 [Candidatus Oleimicrobiaceae bacterium]